MASKYLQLFPIPQELPNIVRDLTREILRYQPQDIVQFCAEYFKAKHLKKEFIWNEAVPRAPRPNEYKVAPKRPSSPLIKPHGEAKNSIPSNKTEEVKVSNEKQIKEVHKAKEIEKKVHDESFTKRDSQNPNDISVISGASSLPENHDEAAGVYVNSLLDKVQKHIIASS